MDVPSALIYGWGGQNEPSDVFWMKCRPITREPKEWKEEVYRAAFTIANATSKPLWLGFNGDIEGQVMCRAFFDQGINFHVFTLEHPAFTGRQNFAFAKKWCKERGIEQHIV